MADLQIGYKVLKAPFNSIKRNTINYNPIFDAIQRMDKLTILAYQFLKLFLLYQFDNKQKLITITSDTIITVFRVLMTQPIKKGRTSTETTIHELKLFTQFYDDVFKPLINQDKIDYKGLHQIITYTSVDIMKNITNNIGMHFPKHLENFVHQTFKTDNSDIFQNLSKKELKLTTKKVNNNLYKFTNTLMNMKSIDKFDNRYQVWFKKYGNIILPTTNNLPTTGKTHRYYIKSDPHLYIYHMIAMIKKLEELDKNTQPLITVDSTKIQTELKTIIDSMKVFKPKIKNIKKTQKILFKRKGKGKIKKYRTKKLNAYNMMNEESKIRIKNKKMLIKCRKKFKTCYYKFKKTINKLVGQLINV